MTRPSTTRALANAMVASDTIQAGSIGAMMARARKASAPARFARNHMSNLPRLDLREQAIRTEHEDPRHDAVDDKKLELWNEMNRGRAAQADDERTEQRTFDRPQAAGDDHGKREDDHLYPDAERYRDLWRHYRAAERAQHRPEHEGEREHDGDIDAEGRRGLLIEHHDREEASIAGIFQRPMGHGRERDRKRDQAHVIARQHERADFEVAGSSEGLVGRIGVRPPNENKNVLQDQEHRIGDQNDYDLVLPVDEAQNATLEHNPYHQADQHGDQHHQEKAAGHRPVLVEIDADGGRRAVGPKRVERAMGHVEDLHDPEDQGEADRHHEKIGRVNQAVGENGKRSQHDEARRSKRG